MNTRPSLVTLHDPTLIVPIHGLDGPCLTLELDRLADALTLHRQLKGSLLLFDDDEAIRYQFGDNPPQFIDPLIQESQPDGYDLVATLLDIEARVLLGHYETQAAVDAAYNALLDYAAWDPTPSFHQTVQTPQFPDDLSDNEDYVGDGDWDDCPEQDLHLPTQAEGRQQPPTKAPSGIANDGPNS